jgi:hypothetical protein
MRPEKQRLLADLLGGEPDARREAALLAGGRMLRRKRRLRLMMRCTVVAVVLGVAVVSRQRKMTRQPTKVATTAAPSPSASVQPQALTDDQLLALFPDTPVALATLKDGRKRLIFPRPGDEARFVRRL